MELEKLSKTEKQEDVNIYTELFSKKEDSIKSSEESGDAKNIENNLNAETIIDTSKNKVILEETKWKEKFSSILQKVQKINVKNLTIGFLIGIIANISYYHYDTVQMQAKSQRLTNGLMYNLAESNDLNQIATNIYLGMKDSGWEPTVKISNDKIFVFSLEGGGEFTITKNTDLVTTKFHVSIKNFSKEMVKALRIQTESNKVGGASIFIGNKDYNADLNEISFDFNKIGYGTLPEILTVPSPSISPSIIPMPVPPLPNPNIDPGIISKAPNIDPGIVMKNNNIVNIPVSDELSKNLNKSNEPKLTKKQKQELEKLTDKYIEDSKKVMNEEKKS